MHFPRNPYRPYVEADVTSPEFRKLVLDGLAEDEDFAGKLVQLDADYGGVTGRDVVRALTSDPSLLTAQFDLASNGIPYRVRDAAGRVETLRVTLVEASIQATSAMVVADDTGFIPVTDDPVTANLLNLRAAGASYVGSQGSAARLGLEVVRAVIPDAALQRLTIGDIIDYRKKARDAYHGWSVELNRLAARIDDLTPSEAEQKIRQLIATEVAPKLVEYRNEMASTRDKLFGDLLKSVRWQMPSISIGALAGLSYGGAVTAFLAGLASAAGHTVPAIVDYVQGQRAARRKNAYSYLIRLGDEGK